MKVKICGITNINDAITVAELSADALGFIFVRSSPRYILPVEAKNIIKELPPFIVPVGVFADASQGEILEMIGQTGIRCVQLHGNETPEQISGIPLPVIKSIRVQSNFDPQILVRYSASAFLLDTYVEGKSGGTGKTFDWKLAVAAKKYGRIILAGGLSPENIIEAVRTVQPYAVDVNSGVESEPGVKDKRKLEELFKNIRKLQID